MVTSSEVVEQARKYVGTPFRHQGRARPEGRGASESIDCVGLLVCVGEDLGLVDAAGVRILRSDYMDRGPQEFSKFLQEECRRRLSPRALPLRAGDIVTLRAPNAISHCGIIAGAGLELTLIFAYPLRMTGAIRGRLVEVRLDERWRGRVAGIFSYPGVA